MDWIEIAVLADDEAVDAVAEVLRTHGRGVAIDVPFNQPRLDEAPQRDPTRRPVVKTYIPEDASAPVVQQEIERALWHLSQLRTVEPLSVRRIREEDWANAWKPFFPIIHVGERTVIVPAWRRYRRRDHELVIRLDPGLAFGTGTHPTTQLCLRQVERVVRPGHRVLDVGTGSGILAIAAARAGAGYVLGVDIDPLAVDAARANVRRNRLGRRVQIREGSAREVALALGVPASIQPEGDRTDRRPVRETAGRGGPDGRSFDCAFANLTARVNTEIATWLAAVVHRGGLVVASGILAESAPAVIDAFAAAGLGVIDQQQDGDWVALVAQRADVDPFRARTR